MTDQYDTNQNFRRFRLVRHEDNTGTSGTGIVARGVQYPDGAVHMQWINDDNDDLETNSNGVAFKPAPDGIEATREIHGHDGRTTIEWIDKETRSDTEIDCESGEHNWQAITPMYFDGWVSECQMCGKQKEVTK